jgi:hypothetical protein
MLTTLAMLGAAVPRAHAGDREWAVAGKVLTGIGAGIILAKAFEPPPVYVAPPPVIVRQPATVVYQSVPVQQVVYQQPAQTTAVVQTQPVTVIQQPVYATQQPIVVQQPVYIPSAVVVPPAPVVYAAPVYVRPAPPVFGIHLSFGHGYHHRYPR